MPFFLFDPSMIVLIPALILAFYAQMKVKGTFKRYSQIRSASGLTGVAVAKQILNLNGIGDIHVQQVQGQLTDHYHPGKRELFLSESVYASNSIAALGVAAHEVGHALQHSAGYAPLKIRNSFVPAANFGSTLAFPIFLVGFIFTASVAWLMDVGIFLFAAALLFHLVTLPVELDASHRAIASLNTTGILQGEEILHARKVLNAAAWTYIAAATMALSQLIRLLILRSAASNE